MKDNMGKPKLIICQGVPGSGKTTWAKEKITTQQGNADYSWMRVNRDDLRRSTGVNYHFKNEGVVTQMELAAIKAGLEAGKNVISDNTNLNDAQMMLLTDLGDKCGAKIEVKKFEITYEEAIKRNKERPEQDRLPQKAIRSFYHKYYPGFDKKVDERNYVPYNPELPDCIISDIDGTISLMNGRNPFKGEDCESDLPNSPVRNLLHDLVDKYTIILFSGRNGESQPQTEKWLDDNAVPYDELYMREPKNMEKDSLLKERFYNEHIKGKYNVRFVLDDRDQVVKTWRDLGLPCFQVHYGDF